MHPDSQGAYAGQVNSCLFVVTKVHTTVGCLDRSHLTYDGTTVYVAQSVGPIAIFGHMFTYTCPSV